MSLTTMALMNIDGYNPKMANTREKDMHRIISGV